MFDWIKPFFRESKPKPPQFYIEPMVINGETFYALYKTNGRFAENPPHNQKIKRRTSPDNQSSYSTKSIL